MKMADGMFRDIFYDISKEYPDIAADDKIVDNVAMQLVMHPQAGCSKLCIISQSGKRYAIDRGEH